MVFMSIHFENLLFFNIIGLQCTTLNTHTTYIWYESVLYINNNNVLLISWHKIRVCMYTAAGLCIESITLHHVVTEHNDDGEQLANVSKMEKTHCTRLFLCLLFVRVCMCVFGLISTLPTTLPDRTMRTTVICTYPCVMCLRITACKTCQSYRRTRYT